MFDRDKWIEILNSMMENPLRTILTSISVAVGIFILVVLLGLGKGLQEGSRKAFADDVLNTIWVRSGSSSIPYGGFKSNRRIQYKEKDHQYTKENVKNVDLSSSMLRFWSVPAVYKNQTSNFGIRCVSPEYIKVEKIELRSGRFLNIGDMDGERKVVVIGKTIVEEMFDEIDPIGEYIRLNGVTFLIVGTFEEPNSRWGNRQAYLPMSTGQGLFGKNSDRINMFVVGTGETSYAESEETVEEIDSYLRAEHVIAPDDRRAVRVNNMNQTAEMFENVFMGIEIFILTIGFLTLFIGIIGVSNIMSIVIRERTKEFGVRKALGASPYSIVSLVLQEAFIMTLISGLLGFLIGIPGLYLISSFLPEEYFVDPHIDLKASVQAIIVLVLAGLISGLIPALRAVRIKPIEALKEE